MLNLKYFKQENLIIAFNDSMDCYCWIHSDGAIEWKNFKKPVTAQDCSEVAKFLQNIASIVAQFDTIAEQFLEYERGIDSINAS